MILQLGDYKLFKTQVVNDTIKQRILTDISNKFSSTFANPISGFDLKSTVELYSEIIEQLKSELGISGTIEPHQAWVNNYKPGEWIDTHKHNIETSGHGFTAIHYIRYTLDHNPTYFIVDDSGDQPTVEVQENDILIYPREIPHGTVGTPEAKDNRITLVFDFSIV